MGDSVERKQKQKQTQKRGREGLRSWALPVPDPGFPIPAFHQLTATRSASPNWSLPETTMRSPSLAPETIST